MNQGDAVMARKSFQAGEKGVQEALKNGKLLRERSRLEFLESRSSHKAWGVLKEAVYPFKDDFTAASDKMKALTLSLS